jgi:hypothetical protein
VHAGYPRSQRVPMGRQKEDETMDYDPIIIITKIWF